MKEPFRWFRKTFMVHDVYDVYGTPNTSRVDETSFTIEPATTEVTSTLRLKVH